MARGALVLHRLQEAPGGRLLHGEGGQALLPAVQHPPLCAHLQRLPRACRREGCHGHGEEVAPRVLQVRCEYFIILSICVILYCIMAVTHNQVTVQFA